MHHISITPFGSRPVTAVLIKAEQTARGTAPLPHVDKWDVFRQLCVARLAFDLTDRDLNVLNALLSFHQGSALGDNASLVVFPSNRALSERAHGMPESTLRRHLAALVRAGVIVRRDSPNGKRYAHKSSSGDVVRAYGFDLRPLLTRAEEIARACSAAQDAAERMRLLRHDITVVKRDALKLAHYGQDQRLPGDWDSVLSDLLGAHKAMRRNLPVDDLEQILVSVQFILVRVQGMLNLNSQEMSGSDVISERHLQNSNKEPTDLEPCLEQQRATEARQNNQTNRAELAIPLDLVRKACPDLHPYAQSNLRDWTDFVRTAETVRGMMGISPDAYDQACASMGRAAAAVAVACILQNMDRIHSPGGYLRALSRKAEDQAFSVGPMVMALLNGSKS